jgi:nucleoside-diphosphate-sugar epimerase
VPDNTKAARLLGFEAKTDIEEGLERTVEWHRARRPARTVVAVG